jgi:hypothetical protein
MPFRLRGYHPLRRAIQDPSTMTQISYSLPRRQPRPNAPTTPTTQRLPAITRDRFSLIRFRSPLLTESRLFSLPAGTEMFHFPAFPPHALYIQARVTGHVSSRVSPFGHPRITARLPAPRGLSQAPTSFIGSWCQGIHRMPLQTCYLQSHNIDRPPTTQQNPERPHQQRDVHRRTQRCSRPLCSSQATNGHQPRTRHQPPPTRHTPCAQQTETV